MTNEGDSAISVLLVDDERNFAVVVAQQLTRAGESLSVDVETDPGAAVDLIDAGAYDCVVSDYEMPGTDGLELLETVREDWPDLPFVLFTGKGSEEIASDAISAGVTEYMQKTTNPDQFRVLANRIRNAVEKYRTEQELERAENRYRRLVEQNLTGIYIVQGDVVEYANPKVAEVFGYPQDELLGMSVFDLVAEEDHDLLRENIDKRESGEVEELNYTVTGVRKNGKRFELEVHSGRIDYEGESALIGTLVDVDEYEAYEREREEYRELFETVGDPMYVLDDEGYVEKTNRAMAEMLGYETGELIGSHASRFLPDDDVEAGERLLQSFLGGDSEPPETVEVDFVTADGERIPCEANLTILTDDGLFRGSVGVVRVIADRKERERELEEYETIVETAPDGVFIVDESGTIVSGNRTGAAFMGYERDELIGESYDRLVEDGVMPERFVDEYVETVDELVAGETDRRKAKLETTVTPQAGVERTCEIHIAPLTGKGGEFRGTVGVVRDVTERTTVEEALRTERDRLSALFENIPEPTIVYEYDDGEPIVVQTNDTFEATFGYDEETLVGDSIDEHIVPEDDDSAADLNERVLEGERLDVEIERETADGERRNFLLRNAPISTDGDQPKGYAIYTDITERKQSEERVQALFRHSMDCIVETRYADGEPIVRRVNGAFEETFGYDAETVVGEPLDEFIVPEGAEAEASGINDRIAEGEPVEREVTRRTADGERDFLLRAIPFDVGEGAWTYGVYTDITERKQRECRLSALHEATRELMDATSRAEVAETCIEAANSVLGLEVVSLYELTDGRSTLSPMVSTEGAERLFGNLPEFEQGEGLAWRVFESGKPLITDDVRSEPEVYNDETAARSELILPIGERYLFMAASTEVGAFDETDRTLAKVLASNVEAAMERAERESLLREREQALLRQNERLEEFAGVVSHDLRSPLTVAKGNAYLVRETGEDAHLDELEAALDRMEQLIDDLLTLARQGESVDETEPVPTADVVEAAWRSVDTADATLDLGGVDDIEADSGRLQQLLENLFRNAVEHGGEDVTVGVGPMTGGFYVEDDGVGLPDGEYDRLFETGFTTDQNHGTGFGLSIVEQIAEAHGWTIRVAESDEGGARFEFTGVEQTNVTAEH